MSMHCPRLESFVTRASRRAGEAELVAVGVDLNAIAFFEFSLEDLNRQGILNQTLDRPLERARSVNRVVSFVGKQCLGAIGDIEGHLSARQVLAQPLELNIDNGFDLVAAQVVEDDRLVNPVEKVRFKRFAQSGADALLQLLAILAAELKNVLAAEVRGHN